MRANIVFIWLLASTFALSVKSKPHGKHKASDTANEKDVLPEEANEGQVLPTFITFEASSQEHEDEEMSSEDNANAHTDKADAVLEGSERNDKSTPVLLSEEELVDLLKEELKESEEAEESVEEEESVEDEESEEGGERADEGKTQSEEAGDIIESEAADQEERDVEETSEEEDAKLSDEVEEEMKEENEKEMEKEEREVREEVKSVEASEGDSVNIAEESGVEETDGSTGSEIPADLDYAADSDSSQPLQTEPQADDARLLSKTDAADVKEEDELTSEKAAAAAADDYEQDFQNTEASESVEEVADQGNDKGEGSPAETKSESDFQEPKSSVELGGARLAGKEDVAKEENGNNDSASHAKGKKRKHKKNQRVRKHPMQRDEGQHGRGRIQEDAEGSNIDNTVHKAKRRRAGKWATLVGMNPVQIRATVDLYPSARPSLVGGIHRPEAPADPCDNFRCKRGKTCKLDENNKPSCVCRQPSECPPSVNEFDNVCGTDNNTYDTSCELFATKCNLEGTKKGHRLHLDYTGPCKFIAPCLDTELIQFPLRMRDWLKNVLLQLYEHDSMTPGFLTSKQRVRVRKIYESERRLHAGDHTLELLAQDFEKNYNMYIYPVHWQFAQIDQHPPDRFLSHSELAPLRVPLVPMEHCTSRFFQECDADKDKQVSFKEWTQCFGIKDEDMDVNLLF